ncbi:MAG: LuxR C-terminal-related transcriptional regulator [Bacillota bacterium]
MGPALRTRTHSPAVRSGLALGGLYGWLLTFPMFGPLLFDLTGESALLLGMIFTVIHGAAMPVVGMLPLVWIERPTAIRWAGAGLALTSLLFAAAPQVAALQIGPLALFFMALLLAYLVQAWSGSFARSTDPVATLVVALGTAHLLVAAVSAANTIFAGEEAVALALVAGLAMAGASAIAANVEDEGTEEGEPEAPVVSTLGSVRLLLPGLAFAVGAFLVGGVWYQILANTPSPEWQWRPVVESLIYSLGIILFGDQARRNRPGIVALYSLSLLGLALMGAISMEGEAATIYRSLFLLGRAGADLFYWHFLWRVRHLMGIRRTLGRGLWLSFWMMAIASLTTVIRPSSGVPDSLSLMVGAAVLFLIIPIASREPAELPADMTGAGAEVAAGEAPDGQGLSSPGGALEPPTGLTQTERQVYDLLVKGASDAEIATALFVTRHTVKFHVRNILHKVGVENRKELLSRLVHLQQASGGDKMVD